MIEWTIKSDDCSEIESNVFVIAIVFNPADFADLIPSGAFSTTKQLFFLSLENDNALRYGSGCGLPYLQSDPVIILSK